MKISLFTGGNDPTYVLPLASIIASKGIEIDFIGNDEMQNAEIAKNENINYLNLRGDQNPFVQVKEKIFRILKYYFKLIKYASNTDSTLFHIQWLNKFIYFDRTILNIYYKILGKKIVFTAHNINAGERDANDTLINRLTLKFMYKIVDHIFVHTIKMKLQLIECFNIRENKITVIPFGINNIVSKSELTSLQAKKKLQLKSKDKILLFFGNIAPYKGIEYLIWALVYLKEKYNDFSLIIAGKINKNCFLYWANIQKIIEQYNLKDNIFERIEFIPDEDIELYFKAADVLILPYVAIFQSGVLFLSFNFGLPVIASNVGSLKEDIIEGKTGFIYKSNEPKDLAKKIHLYFHSDLYKNLEVYRNKIIKYANKKYSWEKVGEKTYEVYKMLL